jgi:GNAT superfamily N-acetyltransferase
MNAGPHVTAPEHVQAHHDSTAFDCGDPELNAWLRLQAMRNEASSASRTYVYVICAEGRVVGYYALATGGVVRAAATGKVRRQMPDPIPVMVIGRLAVDARHQGRGLGHGLLRDALLRTLHVAEHAGIRAVVLHAMTKDAKTFYQRAGFQESPLDAMTMMITIADMEKALTTP